MPIDDQQTRPAREPAQTSAAEARMAELILQLTDEVSRAKMDTFMHFAQDRSKIRVHLEPSRDHGLRFILAYPFARD